MENRIWESGFPQFSRTPDKRHIPLACAVRRVPALRSALHNTWEASLPNSPANPPFPADEKPVKIEFFPILLADTSPAQTKTPGCISPSPSSYRSAPFAQPILPVSALIPESCQKDLRAGAEQFTNAIAAQLILHGYSTSTIVKTGAPSLVIHEEAQRLGINLILMSRQQRARVSRFFLGSVSHSIVHHTTCSILLLP